jgi:hypothetical protein
MNGFFTLALPSERVPLRSLLSFITTKRQTPLKEIFYNGESEESPRKI